MNVAELGIKINSNVGEATKAFDRLAESIKKASEALDELNGKAHGGVIVAMVGDVSKVTVKPYVPGLADA